MFQSASLPYVLLFSTGTLCCRQTGALLLIHTTCVHTLTFTHRLLFLLYLDSCFFVNYSPSLSPIILPVNILSLLQGCHLLWGDSRSLQPDYNHSLVWTSTYTFSYDLDLTEPYISNYHLHPWKILSIFLDWGFQREMCCTFSFYPLKILL